MPHELDPTDTLKLNWENTIESENSLKFVNWNAVEEYAISVRRRHANNHGSGIACHVSPEYKLGGRHVVRRLVFQDGSCWIVRLQRQKATPDSIQRLLVEVNTLRVVRERTDIPVPNIIDYEANCNTDIGAPLMLLEYIPADTAMDSFGGWPAHKGHIPTHFRSKFYTKMAKIQVDLTSVRFPKIGSIVQLSDGSYSVGAIPRIGGPFETAAGFFHAWAQAMQNKFPLNEKSIRARTPPNIVDEVIKSINDFPAKLSDFTQHHFFQSGPFPLIHPDLWTSNVLIDSDCDVQGVIDWEDSIVAPWEMVEFMKNLTIVPPVMDGSLYCEKESDQIKRAEQKRYIQVVQETEGARQMDNKLSETLSDEKTQSLAQAIVLYEEGRIGFYCRVFELFY
ncbi:kinase-like domain-containing protein [Phaeosphaeriaceae sp. PMI808]|nr:kinase-like domain-containing protein [Phaeosphaeriaceae sp. PMI808]